MIIIDLPTWMLWVGWFFGNIFLFSLSALLIVVCLNKVNQAFNKNIG